METIRDQILDALVALVQTIKPNDDFDFEFKSVSRGPLSLDNFKQRYAASVSPGRERKSDLFPFIECFLPVDIEFSMAVQSSDKSASKVAERLLGAVQLAIYANKSLDGMVIDIRETGNEIDMDTYADRSVLGVLMLEVHYRHSHTDPRVL